VLIDGFYDDVRKPSEKEIAFAKKIPFEEEEEKKDLGLKSFLHGLSGLDAVKALLFQPTCTINGLLAGYTASGSKTVLPNKAMVKLDFRLVPEQRSSDVFDKLVRHLRMHGFGDIEVVQHGSTEPTRTPPSEEFVQTVIKAAEKVYGKKAVVYPTSPASGPMHLFRNYLGFPVVSAGCAYEDSRGHAPNENITIKGFNEGIKFMATIIRDFTTD